MRRGGRRGLQRGTGPLHVGLLRPLALWVVLVGRQELLLLVAARGVLLRRGLVQPRLALEARAELRLQRLTLASETSWTPTERTLLEHELGSRIYRPVMSFARPAEPLGQLDEALVEREVVPHGVLPALVGAAEELEALLQETVDLGQREALGGRVLDSHDNQGDVRVGRLLLPPASRGPLALRSDGLH